MTFYNPKIFKWSQRTRLLFYLALEIVGFALAAYSVGWIPAIGMLLFVWGYGAER